MARKEIRQALDILESSESGPLQALDALDELEDHLIPDDQGTIRRLDQVARQSTGPLRSAIERCLLRIRRENVDWDVFTTTSAAGEGPRGVSRVLRQAKQALTAAAPFARLAFVERAMAEEHFAVGPVLAVQCRVEKDASVLTSMAQAVGKLGGPTSHASLKALLSHQDPQVRKAAVEGLGYQRGSRALGLLIEALGDPEQAVRYQALEVLESCSPRAVLEALQELPEVAPGQVHAVPYLQGLGSYPGSTELLIRRLESPVRALAAECLVALAGLGHPEAKSHLSKLSVSRNASDQQTFARAQRAWPRE